VVAESIEFSGQAAFTSQDLADWKIEDDDIIYGKYKTQDNVSYLQVFQAGHNLAFWRMYSVVYYLPDSKVLT
jgi:hypothetical protein